MNYQQKYQKYKAKYLKLKYTQSGGGMEETFLYYDMTTNAIKGTKFKDNLPKVEIKFDVIPKDIQDIITASFQEPFTIIREDDIVYRKYTITGEPYKMIIITEKNTEKKVSIMYYNLNVLVKKILYIYPSENPIIITLNEFNKNDETYLITNNNKFKIANNEITIEGICNITRKPWNIEFIVKEIRIGNVSIYVNMKTEMKALSELFQRYPDDRFSGVSNMELCTKLEDKIIKPKILDNNQTLYRNLLLTVCNKIKFLTNKDIFFILTRYNNLLKFIIKYDLMALTEHLTPDLVTQYSKEITKFIPSTIDNKNIQIKNNDDNFESLREDHRIVFDSGNDSVTIIGRNIVNYLGLKTSQGCMIRAKGIGGNQDYCGDYVELKFKFADKYFSDKEYVILGFVDDKELTNTLLFGHANGLDVLFKDGYAIKNQFDIESNKHASKLEDNAHIYGSHKRLNEILSEFINNKNSKKLTSELLNLKTTPEIIHHYITEIPIESLNELFTNLRKTKEILEKQDDKTVQYALEKINSFLVPQKK